MMCLAKNKPKNLHFALVKIFAIFHHPFKSPVDLFDIEFLGVNNLHSRRNPSEMTEAKTPVI